MSKSLIVFDVQTDYFPAGKCPQWQSAGSAFFVKGSEGGSCIVKF